MIIYDKFNKTDKKVILIEVIHQLLHYNLLISNII